MNGLKRNSTPLDASETQEKRAKTLLGEDSDNDSGTSATGYTIPINQEFAKRFDHNKKREELQQRKFTFCMLIKAV